MSAFSSSRFETASAIAALTALTAAPAMADVTAQQVWDNWKGMMAIYGDSGVSIGSEDMAGDTLTVTDLTVSVEDGIESVSATISEIQFTENGDGTVTVTMSEENPMSFTSDGVTLPLTARSEGMTMDVSGTPEEMNYALAADRYGIEAAPGIYEDVRINSGSFFLEGLTGSYTTSTGNLQNIDYAINANAINIDVNVDEPGGSNTIVLSGMIDGLESTAALAMPLDMMTSDNPEAAFVDGLSIEAAYTFGASQYDLNANVDGDVGQASASAAGGAMAVAMSQDGFSYSGGATSPQVAMFGFDIPFPVEIALEAYEYTLDIPLSQADEARDFTLAMALRGATVNDILWSLVDPGEVLPRDPATVAFDVTGKVRPLFDFLDPAQQMEAAMADMPAEIDSVSLNSLEISAAGAEVTGAGAFTFDNSDMVTIPGVPRPEGELKLAVNGANGLMDKLIQMGLLPEDQAMGARMMMGLFATPVGDDMLESVIEVNDQGHVLANGQRLQ